MSRTKPVTVPVSELPAFLRNARDAEPVALALAAQAQLTHQHADELAQSSSPLVETAVRTQADELNEAAHAVRQFAKRLAHRPADVQHNPNADGAL
jgi:hypothetical protein